MSANILGNGILQGSIIEEGNVVKIYKDNMVINPNLAKGTPGTEEKGFTVTTNSEGGPRYAVISIEGGKTYTISAYLKGAANINLYTLNSGGNVAYTWVNKSDLTPEYKFYSLTFTMATGKGTTNEIYICTRYTSSPISGDWFKVLPNSVKLEEGNKATPWIPNINDTIYSSYKFSNANTTIINPVKSKDFYEY